MVSKKLTILVVDDEPAITDFICQELEGQDIVSETAGNGREALELCGKNKFDAVISDIRMPVMDGIQFIAEFRKINQKTPFFFMTGFSEYSADDVNSLGASAIVFKPFDSEEVISMLVDAARGAN